MEFNLTNTVKTGYLRRFNFSNSNHVMYTILLSSFQMQYGFLIISLKNVCLVQITYYALLFLEHKSKYLNKKSNVWCAVSNLSI